MVKRNVTLHIDRGFVLSNSELQISVAQGSAHLFTAFQCFHSSGRKPKSIQMKNTEENVSVNACKVHKELSQANNRDETNARLVSLSADCRKTAGGGKSCTHSAANMQCTAQADLNYG